MKTKRSSLIVPGIIILALVSACLYVPPAPEPTPCGAPSPNIFALPSLVPTDAAWANLTQQQAFDFLTSQVERWSNYEDILLDNITYRITVTLIAPDLLRAVYLTEAVHRHRSQEEIAGWLKKFNESQPNGSVMQFLVTISANSSLRGGREKVIIDPNNLTMFDNRSGKVNAANADGAFLTAFDVADGPYAAYVSYPLMAANCQLHLNLTTDKSVTLELISLKIADDTIGKTAWTIPLQPLISTGLPILAPGQSAATPIVFLEPQPMPPTPIAGEHSAMVLAGYWADLAKFIWAQLSATTAR